MAGAAALAGDRGLTDAMGQLNHERGGRLGADLAAEHGNGRMTRRGDAPPGSAAGSWTPRLAGESHGDPLSVARARDRQESSPPTLIDPRSDPVASYGGEEPTEADRRRRDRVGGEAPANGTWAGAPGSAPAIRPGGRGDDEGGPGDTPASVAWLRAGRGTGYQRRQDRAGTPGAPGAPRRFRRTPPGLGALAGAVRPHRRLPAPPVHPHRRHARHRGAAHRHRPGRARDHARPGRRPVRQARRRDDEADQARPARPRDAGGHR